MKLAFAAALLAVAEAGHYHGGKSYIKSYDGGYAKDYGYAKSYSYSKPTVYVKYNHCGHHSSSDSSDSDSSCDYHSSDYSSSDYGYGYKSYNGRARYYKYRPRYNKGRYYYGRKYATYGGKIGYATYKPLYAGYAYKSYAPSRSYYAKSYAGHKHW